MSDPMRERETPTAHFERVLLLGSDVFPPLSSTVRAEFAAASVPRPTPEPNTDHYLIVKLGRTQETLLTSLLREDIGGGFSEQMYAVVLADGLGPAGELASRVTISALLHLTLRYARWNVRVDDRVAPEIVERITHFYRQIDSALVTVNRAAILPLHTTLTAVASGGRDLFFAHTGHIRAYLYRSGELIQLTRDHTHMVRRSAIRSSLVDVTNVAVDLHHILTDALGAGTVDPQIDIERFTLVDNDRLLLCTNGLTDVVDDNAIAAVLSSPRALQEQCDALIALAREGGTLDDVTAIVARYYIPE